jgi:tetratricopeptide (TPR) repeat protein
VDERLGAALFDCLEALEAGQSLDNLDLQSRYPDLADALREYFAGREEFEHLAAPLRAAVRESVTPAPAQQLTVSEMPPLLPAKIVGRRLGDYELLEKLGQGGMGVVYKARQKSLNRLIALKVLLEERAAAESQRFRNEAQTVAELDHPRIVPVYEVGAYGNQFYFSMKLIEGGSLAQHLDRYVADPRAAARLVAEIARAVHHAHQRGVLHRDLKPSNILLDGEGRPHVTDFGLAKRVAVDSSLTQSGQLVGTPSYMAPEQATSKKEPLTTAADVYGLGAILYALLTGRPPFRAETVLETLEQVKEREPDRPRTSNPRVDRDLEVICLKCLRKEPEERYASAAALAEDLEHWLIGEAIQARPLGRAARFRRWCRRNPMVASLTATAAILTVVLFVGLAIALAVIWQKEHDTAEALKAVQQAKKETEASEAEARAALEFLEERVIAAARPELDGGLGYKVTLRQAVEAALPFVEKSFADQPLIEARMRRTLGLSFLQLGDAKVAMQQFQLARALYTKQYGPYHADTLKSMNQLANSYYALGHYADALKLQEETLGLMKTRLGPEHLYTLGSMNDLVGSYNVVGRPADALKVINELLPYQKARLGPYHPDTLRSMHNLAECYFYLGRKAEALKLQEETLALRKSKLGPQHSLGSMHNLANYYEAFGRYSEALQLREQVFAIKEAKLGRDHSETLSCMTSLAGCYCALGRYADAIKLSEKALPIQKTTLGPLHPATLGSMHTLANCYDRCGRYADAMKLRENLLPAAKAKFGVDHRKTLSVMEDLINDYVQLGRHADALTLLQEMLPLKAKLSLDNPETLRIMGNMAYFYGALNRMPDAVKIHEETLALRRAKLGADHQDTLQNMALLVNCYMQLGRADDGIRLGEQLLTLVRSKSGPDHPDTLSAMHKLAIYYGFAGRDAEALRLGEETLALRTAKLGRDHPDTLRSMQLMAWACASHPDVKFRNSKRAMELAKQVLQKTPESGPAWNALLVAYYRSGEWQSCVDALHKSIELNNDGAANSGLYFVFAMTHWQLGHKEDARRWYDKAVAWMNEHLPASYDSRRFRAEAEELLQVPKNRMNKASSGSQGAPLQPSRADPNVQERTNKAGGR